MNEFKEETRTIRWMKIWLGAQLLAFILLYGTLSGKIVAQEALRDRILREAIVG